MHKWTIGVLMAMAFSLSACSDNSASFPIWLAQKWKLTQLYNGSANIPMHSYTKDEGAFVVFNNNGSFTGNAGCNAFFGNYISSETNDIQFGGVGMTRKMCGPESMAVEDTFIKLFADGGGTIAKLEGDTLSLARGEIRATLVRVDTFAPLTTQERDSVDER